MNFVPPDTPSGPRLPRVRVIAAATALYCLVVGSDALLDPAPADHRMGIGLLVIAGVSVLGGFRARGVARSSLRWLVVLAVLQVAFLGWLVSSPISRNWSVLSLSGLPLVGWLPALARASVEIRAAETPGGPALRN